MAKNWIAHLKLSFLCFVLYVGYSLASDLNSAFFVINHWLNVILFLGFLNNNTTVLYSSIASQKDQLDRLMNTRGKSRGTGPPLKLSIYTFDDNLVFILHFILTSYSLFPISFFPYNWKMTILIVYVSLTYIYSIMLIFSHLSLITILNKASFYPFRSSHWEIFYKIATSVLH